MARLRLASGLGLALILASSASPVLGANPAPSRPDVRADRPVRTVPPAPTEPSACPALYLAPPTFTPERRQALQRRLDRLRARSHLPGISVAITFPDGTTWTGTSGFADVARQEPVQTDTAFAVASISKTFVSALILTLRDEGRLDLEAAAADYVPELDLDERVTIQQLLDHTSGLHDFFFDPRIDKALMADRARSWTADMALAYVGKPYFAPGKAWHYSNTNYLLLGLIAERVDGRRLADQLRARFFDPLGLVHTYEQIGETPRGPLAHGYRLRTADDDDPTDLHDGTRMAPFTSVVTAAGGAGSLASTPTDLVHWVRRLYNGGVLAPESLAAMTAGTTSRPTKVEPIPYGLGVQGLSVDGRPSLGHSGRLLGFRSVARWFPSERVAIATLTNQSRVDPMVITRSLLRLALTPVLRCYGSVERR